MNQPNDGQAEQAQHVVVVGPDGSPLGAATIPSGSDEESGNRESVGDMVEQPAKVMRIGTMIKQLLEEVRAAPLDDASRNRLREIHKRSIAELEDGLGPLSAGRLSVELDPGLLWTDAEKLRRILVNLVENAVKYAPQGPIEVTAKRVGRFWQFAVADRGPGISMHDREKIFERFVQLDQSSTRRQGGTGLGLYLCRQLVEVLGGTISVSGRNRGGTSFTVRVPDAGPQPLPSPGAGAGVGVGKVVPRRMAPAGVER